MKKASIVLSVALSAAVLLTSCGKSQKAKDAEAQIDELRNSIISIYDDETISMVESAVNEMSDKEKAQVENLDSLTSIRARYEKLAEEATSEVETLINDIGEVSLDSESDIDKAQKAYEELPDNLKENVSNGKELTSLRQTYEELKLQNVVDLINAIGEVSLESADKVTAANTAYQELSDDEKESIQNVQILEDAKTRLKELHAEEKEQEKARQEERKSSLISSMKVTKDDFKECTFYEPSRMPYYNNVRSCVLPYIGQNSNGHKWIVIRYDYAGDEWVFFTKVTILTDEGRYEKEVEYFDRTTGVGGGMVGELYDDVNTTSADIKMLEDMASSANVRVRFEGSDYYRDITIGDKDKTAIKDVLELYNLL